MKKIIITVALISVSLFASAQTTKKPVAKPVVAEAKAPKLADDTTAHTQTYLDMAIRIQAMQALLFGVTRPGDVTPNQKAGLIRSVDSLLKIDIDHYNRIESIKQAARVKKP